MENNTNGTFTGRARRRSALAALALGIALLAACNQGGAGTVETTADAAMHRANPARTGLYAADGPTEYQSIKWQFAAADWVFGAPAVLGDTVFVAGYDGHAYALDRETGAEKWRFDSGAEIIASPAAAGDLLFVGNMGGVILALDGATGEERWRVESGAGFTGSPAVVGDTVYFGNEAGLLSLIHI